MAEQAENVVLIGKKPTMNYVLAVVTQFSDGQNEVHLKARGRAISKAVDVAQIVKNRFIKDVDIAGIEIGTDTVTTEDGREINVSTIDIVLKKA